MGEEIGAPTCMAKEDEEKEVDCDGCVSRFMRAGGCECWMDDECDEMMYVPDGCDMCGDAAAEACGIPTDEEEPPVCPEVMCMMHCEFGYVQDENGCDMCECIEEPRFCCRAYTLDCVACTYGLAPEDFCEGYPEHDLCAVPEEPECPEVMCMMHCEFGYVQDENGCDMCECIEEPPMCPEVMCMMYCES